MAGINWDGRGVAEVLWDGYCSYCHSCCYSTCEQSRRAYAESEWNRIKAAQEHPRDLVIQEIKDSIGWLKEQIGELRMSEDFLLEKVKELEKEIEFLKEETKWHFWPFF